MICCVSVGLEVHIGHEHSSNSLFINAVTLGLSQTKAFPVEVGVLMSGSLKPYFYFVSRERTETVMLKQILESIPVIWDREHVRQHLAVQTENEAIVFVLGHIDFDTDHDETSREKNGDTVIHRYFAL